MIRVGSAPFNDGLGKITESWASGVSDAMQGQWGYPRSVRQTGVSVAPTKALVSLAGRTASVFIEYPAVEFSSARIYPAEVIDKNGDRKQVLLNGVLLSLDLADNSTTGVPVRNGIVQPQDHNFSQGVILSGTLTLEE